MMIVELNKAIFTSFVSYKAESYNFLWDPSLPTSSTNQGLYQDTKRLISSLSLLFQHLPLLYFSNFSFLTESHLTQAGLKPQTLDPLVFMPQVLGL